MIDFNIAYRVSLPVVARCRIMLGSEMEEVSLSIWNSAAQAWGYGRRNKRVSDERYECCGFVRWGNEREKCVCGREGGCEE